MIDHISPWFTGVTIDVYYPDRKAHRDQNRDAKRCLNSSRRTPCDPPMSGHVKCPRCIAVSRYGANAVRTYGFRLVHDSDGRVVDVALERFRHNVSAA